MKVMEQTENRKFIKEFKMSKNQTKKFKNVTITLDDQTIKTLKNYANENLTSMSNVIRTLVRKHLQNVKGE